MSMGTFDHEEYERREKQISSVDTSTDDRRRTFEGRLEYSDDSIDDLLARFDDVKSNAH
ncbi:DUF5786 family protein [Halosolutus gelatinilyticus]|uniref:DUF5786 family protein n=1 Tax=Halosolutus gelatinilyticus TaxID=2931975 RepID=UPI001FF5E694|nr:DUF5786 family protein [Halosolutus gelatinilyticus]